MTQRLTAAAAIVVLTAACGPGADGSGNAAPGTRQVNVQVSGHGAVQLSTGQQCKDKCVVSIANGTRVSATASPDGGWTFSGWGGSCGGGGACQFTVDRDLELDATFALVPTGPNQHALTVARTGSGTIRSSPAGIDCGSSCSAPFDDGTSVTLSATPDQGWRFDGWSGACSGAGDCPVAMNADATVTATFVAEQPPPPPPPADRQTLTVTIAGQGAVKSAPPGIDCPSACSADFPAGSKVTLSAAAADSGHGFAGWSGACSGQGGCAVTMTADQSVGAAFATTTQISVVISPPAVSLTTGATQRFTATVSGSTDAAVAWSVAEGPAGGSIDTTGLYTAPQAAGTFNVVAASHADPSRSATATVTVTKPTGASISSCTTITAPGTFAVTADISSLGTCLDIHDVHDVTIDCGGRTVDGAPALSMANVDRFSLTNCNFVSTGAIYNLTKVSNGTFQHDTFGTTSVNVVHATDVLIDHNTFNASYQQTYSQRVVISNNTLVSQTRGGSYTGTLIGSRSGSGNQIVGNVMDGKWSGAPVSDTDDGVLLFDETGDTVSGNTISNVFDCGIETVGLITGATISNNNITRTGVCGIGGWFWNSLRASTISGNVATDVPTLFRFLRFFGLRPAGFDDLHELRADTAVYFSDNVFDGNRLLNPSGDFSSSTIGVYSKLGYDGSISGVFPGERPPGPSDFVLTNNVFRNNDFGHLLTAPRFGAPIVPGLVIDGGGNVCNNVDGSAYPLACH